MEIELIVHRIEEFSEADSGTSRKSYAENQNLWKELTQALQSDIFVVDIDYLKFDTAILYPKFGTPDSQRRNRLQLVKTGWSEAVSVGFVRQAFGDVFNQLLKSSFLTERKTNQSVRSFVRAFNGGRGSG